MESCWSHLRYSTVTGEQWCFCFNNEGGVGRTRMLLSPGQAPETNVPLQLPEVFIQVPEPLDVLQDPPVLVVPEDGTEEPAEAIELPELAVLVETQHSRCQQWLIQDDSDRGKTYSARAITRACASDKASTATV